MPRLLACLFSLLLLATHPARAGDALPGAGPGNDTFASDDALDPKKFLPVEEAYPLAAHLDGGTVVLDWNITPGYYLYRERFGFAFDAGQGEQDTNAELPEGEAHDDPLLGPTQIYRGQLSARIALPGAAPVRLIVESQGCADAGLCYPPRTQWFEIDPAAGTVREAQPVAHPPATPAPPARPAPTPVATPAPLADTSLASMLLLAFLGGAILNLMPCVFPVLSLKLLSLGSTQLHHRALHAILYSIGVVLSFLLVAAVLIALRAGGAAIGWGFQLQSPVFVAVLAYLFVVMGLAMSGFIELGAGMMGFGDSLVARHGGYAGSFFTGVLATVVASPCTAPFMGSALGFALTQPAVVALLVFGALGVGMAVPFLLFGLVPALRRLLPRPGGWMERLKHVMAFPLYASAGWLLWVIGRQTGMDGALVAAGGCALAALAVWQWQHAHKPARRAIAIAATLLAVLLLRLPALESRPSAPAETGDSIWQPYTEARFAELRAAGKPVFINVTADWCITCLANERIALSNPAVLAAFARGGIATLIGDWTNADPRLTALLQSHGRSGVPLYLYYSPGSGNVPEILPQLLTPDIVINTIQPESTPENP